MERTCVAGEQCGVGGRGCDNARMGFLGREGR